MPRIGLGDLRDHTSEVVRDVEANRTQYVITDRGEPVAVITPYAKAHGVEAKTWEQYWQEFQSLSAEIGQAWQEPGSAAEVVSGLRR
jgi:prevent-host-death family protein